jgi:hypothetical protein
MPVSPKTRFPRQATFWLCLAILVSRIIIICVLAGRWTDLGVQKRYAGQIVAGQVPFRDFFPEYPPLVFLYTALPALIDPTLAWYFPIFRAIACAVDCGIWITLLRVNKDRVGQNLLYLVGTTALGSLIYDRIDIVLGAILMFATISVLNGREKAFQAAIGAGIAFKLIPVVFAPMILAREWKREGGNMLRACALLFAPLLLTLAATAILGGYRFDKLLEFHVKRPVQLESSPAAVAMVLKMFGADGKVKFGFGGMNFESPNGNSLAATCTVLLAIACVASAWIAWRRDLTNKSFALLLGAVLSTSLTLSKVLSPQYFLILLPVLVVLPLPADRTAAVACWLLSAAILVLTGIIFPWFYADLIALRPEAEWMLILRNELLALLSVSLWYRVLVTIYMPTRSPGQIVADPPSRGL